MNKSLSNEQIEILNFMREKINEKIINETKRKNNISQKILKYRFMDEIEIEGENEIKLKLEKMVSEIEGKIKGMKEAKQIIFDTVFPDPEGLEIIRWEWVRRIDGKYVIIERSI